jgi:carboxyl-terminal processing protease
MRGELVGIGIQVEVIDQKLIISQVYPESGAFERRLRPGDHLLQIDRQPVEGMTAEAALARLQGESGSAVELVVLPLGEATARTMKVQRRPLVIRSVEFEPMPEEGIGLVRVLTFHDNTLPEVRDAILQLRTMGMDVLILDLRGNPGGLFRSAVQVAELFLSDGVIVLTHSRLRGYNRTYRADNPTALEIPLVVLVDSETASAAEVVAGALKENQRATLVGQTSFGKGSIQALLPLEKIRAGIRITVAKFYSPANYPYTGRGVTPHVVVDAAPEAQLSAARQEARRLAMMLR